MEPEPAFADPIELIREREWLERLVARLVSDRADRDDIVQDALVHRIAAIDPIRNARGYLARVARGIAWNLRRDRNRRLGREQAVAPSEIETSVDRAQLAERAELQRRVIDELLALGEPQRTVLLLHFDGDHSLRAIANQLAMPEGTVRSHFRRGLERLRSTFDRDPITRNWRALLAPAVAMRRGVGVLGGLLAGGLVMNMKGPVVVFGLVILGAVVGSVFDLPKNDQRETESVAGPSAAILVATDSTMEIVRDVVEGEGFAESTSTGVQDRPTVTASLRGRVIYEETGAPVDDAVVIDVTRFDTPVERARASSDGSIRIDALPVGSKLRFEVARTRSVPSTFDLVLPTDGEHDVEFRIEPQVIFRGRVIDSATHELIPHANIKINLSALGESNRTTSVVADEMGAFEFSAPSRARSHLTLVASHERFLPTRVSCPPDGVWVIPLLRPTRIEGVVRRSDGSRPATPTVRIAVFEFDRRRVPVEWTWPRTCTVLQGHQEPSIDATGRFAFEAIAPFSDVTFEAFEIGSSPVERMVKSEAPGSSQFVEFMLSNSGRTASLAGALTVNGKRGPVPYRLFVNSQPVGNAHRAANDGSFRHDELFGGSASLWVDIPGVLSKSFSYELHAGHVTRVDLDLRIDTSWVAGQVVRRDNTPVADLLVAIRATEREWRVGVKTDAEGRFRVMSALATGEAAIARVHVGSNIHEFEFRGGDEAIHLEIPDHGKLRLRVIDRATRQPIMNAAIRRIESDGSRTEIMPGSITKLPGDLLEIELSAGTHRLEIDRTPAFFSAQEILAIVVAANGREFTEQLVELESADVASVQLEFVDDGEGETSVELPAKPSVFWRRRGESNYSPLPSLARIPSASEDELGFELPVGVIELGFGAARASEPTVFLPPIELVAAVSPHRIRVRKATG